MASQLFYRISWPHVSSPSELIESNKEHLSNYSESSKKIVVLTNIKTSLPKTTTGCGKLVELYLTMASPLQVICLIEMPNWKTKSNKRKFDNVEGPFKFGEIAISQTGAYCILMMKLIDQSFLLEAPKSGQNVICILRDDTDVCVFYLHIGWIRQTCNARYRRISGIDQYLISMPSVLIVVRNAYSYCVCMHSVVVIQLSVLTAKEMSLHWILWYLETSNV